jgi:hypothetical protein
MTKPTRLTLLIIPLVLGACATQDGAQDVVETSSEATMPSDATLQCYRECEYVNGGTVRGCTVGRSGRTRSASYIQDCVNSATGQLRICYRTCE